MMIANIFATWPSQAMWIDAGCLTLGYQLATGPLIGLAKNVFVLFDNVLLEHGGLPNALCTPIFVC